MLGDPLSGRAQHPNRPKSVFHKTFVILHYRKRHNFLILHNATPTNYYNASFPQVRILHNAAVQRKQFTLKGALFLHQLLVGKWFYHEYIEHLERLHSVHSFPRWTPNHSTISDASHLTRIQLIKNKEKKSTSQPFAHLTNFTYQRRQS